MNKPAKREHEAYPRGSNCSLIEGCLEIKILHVYSKKCAQNRYDEKKRCKDSDFDQSGTVERNGQFVSSGVVLSKRRGEMKRAQTIGEATSFKETRERWHLKPLSPRQRRDRVRRTPRRRRDIRLLQATTNARAVAKLD